MSNYRITFAKRGALSFISHLDFNHSFIRILKRAGLPLRYSEGFNPRPKIVFGLPLSVGMEGENEIVDIGLTDELSCEEVKEKLAKSIPADMEIKDVCIPELKVKNIELAEYTVTFSDFYGNADRVCEILKNPPQVLKHTKSGDKMTDIGHMIKKVSATNENGSFILHLTLTAFDSNYLNPEYVVSALNNAGMNLPEEYGIIRQKIIFKK